MSVATSVASSMKLSGVATWQSAASPPCVPAHSSSFAGAAVAARQRSRAGRGGAAAAAVPRGGLAVRAAYTSTKDMLPPSAQKQLSLELPTDDFQDAVELSVVRRQRGGNIIFVDEVKPGSAAAAAGVLPGQQVLAVSDPIRAGEIWDLTNGLASIRYVRQAVSGRAQTTINLRLTPEPIPEYQQALAAARAAVAEAGGATSAAGSVELTDAEKAELTVQLEKMQERAVAKKNAVRQEKLDRRNEYLDESTQSSSKFFFIGMVSLFVVLPLAFVLVAVGTGLVGPR